MNELANGDTAFPGWTFGTGVALNGTIKIKTYDSNFFGAHYSGCIMGLGYIRGSGDPKSLQFVQMINANQPMPGASSCYIEPYPSDDPAASPMPLYYTATEMPGQTTSSRIKFYDAPKRYHPPTSSVTWKGTLYITSWDGKKGVTLHDGIEYGFVAGCDDPKPAVVITSTTQSKLLCWRSE